MHRNGRYVKLAWIGLMSGLALASPARAELVTKAADQGVLAVAPDGSPRVAYVVGPNLYLARRTDGSWRSTRVARLPGSRSSVAGLVVDPRSVASTLVEDAGGKWIVLVRGRKLLQVARARGANTYGPSGLTLDASGRPAAAYAVRLSSRKTYLRLVTVHAGGRLRTRGITLKGFPSSTIAPGAAPVLVGRRLHVVETYTSAAIDWGPKAGGGWEGQYLFASRVGSPVGRVGAVVVRSTLFAAWTQASPELGPEEISVLVTASAQTQETGTVTHGVFVTIANGFTQPEIGAYDWVNLADDWREYAALVVSGPGGEAWQLDGRLEGYAVTGASGGRQVLLSREGNLEWFQATPPAPALPGIEIRMAVDATGKASGTVVAGVGGALEIYREVAHGPRQLVATAPLAPDGSFEAQLPPPGAGTVYRGVYVDPVTGIPFGFLPGVPVGVSG